MDNFTDQTLDSIFGGQIGLLQSKRGYRFNVDSVILASEALQEKGIWLDLGCGNGIIALILALKGRADKVYGLEIQEKLYECARKNVELNGLQNKVDIILGDLKKPPKAIKELRLSGIICNPPYNAAARSNINPDSEKAIARHEIAASQTDILKFAARFLTTGKKLIMIYPAPRLAELIENMRDLSLEPRRLRFLHGNEGESAKHFVICAVKEAGTGLEVAPPLVVHEGGEYSAEMQKLLKGN